MNKLFLGAFALAAVVAVPSVSLAATYAYVNTSGEVMSVEAANPTQAMSTAPSIAPTSGVMLIETTADESILDKSVSGV